MSEPADASLYATDETGGICTDLACQRCGYNLRGLNASGQCPECAAAISLSLHKDLLCFAEPGYVRGLATGCRRILAGVTTVLVTWVLFALVGGLTVLFLPGPQQVWRALVVVLLVGAAVLGALMFLRGLWLITSPQPQLFTTPKQDTARRLVRVYLIVAVVGEALTYSIASIGARPRVLAVFELLGIGVSVFGVIGVTAYFMYLSRVAHRVSVTSRGRYTKVPERARALAYAYAIVLGWFALAGAVQAIWIWGPVFAGAGSAPGPSFAGPAAPFGFLGAAAGCISGLAGLAMLILFLVAARLHYRLRDALQREAALAEQHWGEASRTPERGADASGLH
jgi:hypothetical protein